MVMLKKRLTKFFRKFNNIFVAETKIKHPVRSTFSIFYLQKAQVLCFMLGSVIINDSLD